MSNKKEQFAALDGYPKDGPEMPEREKVHRDKDKHDPGTGRRDREKREGRGKGNWGNALDDQLADYHEEEVNDVDDDVVTPQGEAKEDKNFQGASQYFEDDEDDGENKKKEGKKTVKVPPGYGKVVKVGKDVEVVEVDDSNDPNRKLPKPQPKLEKKPKREPYNPEKEKAQPEEEEEDKDENVKKGKKSRDQQFHSVQHNRNGHNQPPPQKQGPY